MVQYVDIEHTGFQCRAVCRTTKWFQNGLKQVNASSGIEAR
jgi:hypothetical protein